MSDNKLWRVDHRVRKFKTGPLMVECNWLIASDRKEALELATEELDYIDDVYDDAQIVGVTEFYPSMSFPEPLADLPYGEDEGKTILEWMAGYGYSPLNQSLLKLEAV